MTQWPAAPQTAPVAADEEDPELCCHPADLIRGGAGPQTVLALVQEAGAQVLSAAVNGWPLRRIWRRRLEKRLDLRIRLFVQLAQATHETGLCPAHQVAEASGDAITRVLRTLDFARLMTNRLEGSLTQSAVEVRLPRISAPLSEKSGLDIPRCLERLTPQMATISGLYLLGSGASGDSTGFSDLDGLLVFSEVVEHDPEALMHTARVVASSAKYLLARDALQHHGWFVATPSLLRAYPQSLLPLATLRDGVTALGPGRLHVRPITSRLIARRKLWSMVQVFRSLPNGGRSRTPRNLHEEKMLLSQFMLLPSLYLQAVDRYVPKRDSFALARQLLPSAPWEIMDRVSTVRLGWTQPKMGPAWQRLAEAIGPWEAQVAWRRLQSLRCDFYRPRRIPQSWVEEMRVFANCLLSSAEETNRGVKES